MCFRVTSLFLITGMLVSGLHLVSQAQEPQKDFFKKGPGGFGPGGRERKLVAQFDKDDDGRLNNDERKSARELVKKEPGGFGKKGKGGFMPPDFLARPIMEALDTTRDGKLSRDEITKGVTKYFFDIAKANRDTVTEAQLGEFLAKLLPGPPGFGPPGGGGPPNKGFGPPGGGKGGFGKKGPGGFGPGNPLSRGIVERVDGDKNGKLTLREVQSAVDWTFKEADRNADGLLDEEELGAAISRFMPAPEFGPPGFPGGKARDPARPGPKVAPKDVKTYPDAPLYEPTVLRTLFLDFETKDWESELEDFHKTDVEVPATLTVDGKVYANVGVHFRGMSSYMGAPTGYKRSLGVAVDFVDSKQRLYGYKTLNLLNCNGDPSLLSTALYSHIARKFIPAPKANIVKVVINGESWGLYANVQQFNKEFISENFNPPTPPLTKGGKRGAGARWKVPGNPGADGGLGYLGEDVEDYRRRYQIKSSDDQKSWKALIKLCKTLNQTPVEKLEQALKPMLDIDGALKFLALDVALSNEDGYWTRASDYSIYLDAKGKFHLIPHDMNEAFHPGMGFGKGPKGGFGPPPGGVKDMKGKQGGFGPDPLVGLDNDRVPLRSKLLAVPALRQRYLEYVRAIAEELDWAKIGPVVARYRGMIEKEVELDTRKLSSLEAFRAAVYDGPVAGEAGRRAGLKAFADGRRTYLLNHPELKRGGE